MMLVLPVFLANQVKEGPNTAVMQNDTQEYQDSINRTHEDKVYWIVYPFE
jgi:hypothetical protein